MVLGGEDRIQCLTLEAWREYHSRKKLAWKKKSGLPLEERERYGQEVSFLSMLCLFKREG